MSATVRNPQHVDTFGFWFENPPQQDAKKEGICRAFSWILHAVQERPNTRVLIAAPVWAKSELLSVLADQHVPLTNLEIIKSRRSTPVVVRLYHFLHRREAKARRRRLTPAIYRWLLKGMKQPWVETSLLRIASTQSYVVVAVLCLAVMLSLLAMGPVFILSWLALRALRLSMKISQKVVNRLAGFRRRFDSLLSGCYTRVLEYEYEVLAREAAKHTEVRCWVIAWPWARQAKTLPGPKIVSLWDFVPADCPTLFNAPAMQRVAQRCRELIASADAVVSASEYVRDQHAVRFFGVPRKITHLAPITPQDCGDVLDRMVKDRGASPRQAAIQAISQFIARQRSSEKWLPKNMRDYLAGFPFGEVPFLFNATQLREHKNTVNLIRAFELLLRRQHRNLKLVLTGNVLLNPEVSQYIAARNLQYDVLSVPNQTTEVLAAFYYLASLTVAPTLFEAGMPIMFSESVSVGTPIVMGSIPQAYEMLSPKLAELTLFDPFDPRDMCGRIEFALDNSEMLLKGQTETYRRIKASALGNMGREYVRIIEQLLSRPSAIPAAPLPIDGRQTRRVA